MCITYLIGNYLFICTIIKILGFDLLFLKNKEYNKDKDEKKKKSQHLSKFSKRQKTLAGHTAHRVEGM